MRPTELKPGDKFRFKDKESQYILIDIDGYYLKVINTFGAEVFLLFNSKSIVEKIEEEHNEP